VSYNRVSALEGRIKGMETTLRVAEVPGRIRRSYFAVVAFGFIPCSFVAKCAYPVYKVKE
jgi:hypothetical protein